MGQRVKRIKTEVSEAQMAQALINGWSSLFGTIPSKEQIGLLIAQNNLETGKRKSMWNYNVGNITTNGKDQYNYYDDLTTDEQITPGVWKKKNLKYRSYNSLDEGAKDYLKLLSNKHYSNVWRHIVNPNPVAFSKSLKDAGYYTANEKPYTKNIVNYYKAFEKSDAYEQARSGVISPINHSEQQMATNENFLQKLLRSIKNKGNNVINKNPQNDAGSKINVLLDSYLQSVLASEKFNKKLYKKYLPQNNAVICVTSQDYTDSVEFGRILCLAFNEELMAKSFIHTDGKNVEISISIPGPADISFEAIKEITNGIASAFVQATKKIGHIHIKTHLITNKTSSYQPISLKLAEFQYKKFILKFV